MLLFFLRAYNYPARAPRCQRSVPVKLFGRGAWRKDQAADAAMNDAVAAIRAGRERGRERRGEKERGSVRGESTVREEGEGERDEVVK